MHPFIHLSIGFDYIRHYSVGAVCDRIFWSSILLGVFHRALLLFFWTFLSTESSSSWVNDPSLLLIVSNCLFIIIVISSWVTFRGFLSRFSKCGFNRCIRSCSLVVFSLALAVLSLQLTSFILCYAIVDCLLLTESLILSILFCMYSVCSFRYMLADSFCAFYVSGHWY